MFWAVKKSEKKQCTGVRNIEFWISHWRVVVDADVDSHKSNMKQLYLSLTVKRMLYLGNVLLR